MHSIDDAIGLRDALRQCFSPVGDARFTDETRHLSGLHYFQRFVAYWPRSASVRQS